MDILTLDIETIPQEKYVDPESTDVDWDFSGLEGVANCEQLIHDGQMPIMETGVPPALHPSTCRIVQSSFGWFGVDGEKTDVLLISSDLFGTSGNSSERSLVGEILARIASATMKGTRIVTFNGTNFDFWALRIRAALLGIEERLPWAGTRGLLYPFSHDPHCDLRLVLGNGNRYAKGTLTWWAECFGVEVEEQGDQVWAMVRDGRWDDLEKYGHAEALTLLRLYLKVEKSL